MSARPLGSAHRGTAAFLVQRISSVYLGVFTLYLLALLIGGRLGDYHAWTGYFGSGGVRLAWALFVASLLAHIWVGLRSIYMDYLHPLWLRFSVSTATAFGLIALAVWAAYILLRGAA